MCSLSQIVVVVVAFGAEIIIIVVLRTGAVVIVEVVVWSLERIRRGLHRRHQQKKDPGIIEGINVDGEAATVLGIPPLRILCSHVRGWGWAARSISCRR